MQYDWRPDPGRTALYRLFNARGDLIYIGIATKPEERLKAHRWNIINPWRKEIATQKVGAWYDTRQQAEAADKAAIAAERPRYNRRHHPDWEKRWQVGR